MAIKTKNQYISPECEVLEIKTEGKIAGLSDAILGGGELVE